jgi:hypothetical protein
MSRSTLKAMIKKHFAETQSLGVWKKNAKVHSDGALGLQ